MNYSDAGFRFFYHRFTVFDKKIIADCYNASPESVRGALDVLLGMEGARRIAVLGDMKELGDTEVALHCAIGEYLATRKVDILLTVGELARHIAEGALSCGMPREHVLCFDNNTDAANTLTSIAGAGDVILFKASRSMKLETVIEVFTGGI